jgi:hypothetical protein
MDELTRTGIIKSGWQIHAVVEEATFRHTAVKGEGEPSPEWRDKQRLLLADMAIHLLQTALKPGEIELDKLRNNLHAIMTISDGFLPHAGLKGATDKIYAEQK